MPQSVANVPIHIIFSTKNRIRWINKEIRPELHSYMGSVLRTCRSPALIIGSVEDHVHILAALARTIQMCVVVEEVKKHSSRWLKTKSPDLSDFHWQAGYGIFAVCEDRILALRQGLGDSPRQPRALPWAFIVRPVGAQEGGPPALESDRTRRALALCAFIRPPRHRLLSAIALAEADGDAEYALLRLKKAVRAPV